MGKLRHAPIPWEKISTQDQREAAAMGMLVPKPSIVPAVPKAWGLLGSSWLPLCPLTLFLLGS